MAKKVLYEVLSGAIQKAARDRKGEEDLFWAQGNLVPFQTVDRDGPCYATKRDLDRVLREGILGEHGKPAAPVEPSDLNLTKFRLMVSDFGEVAAMNELRKAALVGLPADVIVSLRTHLSRSGDYEFKEEMLAALRTAVVAGGEVDDGDDGVNVGGGAEGPGA